MKNCTGCKFAKWQLTKTGKLHPSGEGFCTHVYKFPPLPPCKWFSMTFTRESPRINGGLINRRGELPAHCTYFTKEKS